MKKLKLKILSGLSIGKEIEFDKELLTIGRDLGAGLRFDPNERVVSSRHAIIERKGDEFYIIDTNSTNGTYVNGIRIQSKKLESGDIISFGKEGVKVLVKIEEDVNKQGEVLIPRYEKEASFGTPFSQAQEPRFDWKKSVSQIGISTPPKIEEEKKKSPTKYLIVGLTVFAIVFLSLIVVVILTANLGIIPAFIAAIVAFLPACLYILPLMFLDRYDPEPIWLLALAFAWGALVAVIFSIVVNTLMGAIFGPVVAAVVSAPIFEEASKGLGVVILLLFFRKEFDDILDGIVYAGVIALGFATVENVLYYGRTLVEGGFAALIVVFILRGALSPFAHVTFTAMTGIGCGIARESHNTLVKITIPVIGYIAAVILHALWNGVATMGTGAFFLVYFILEVPFFLAFVGFSIYTARRQNRILRNMLAMEVARGLISQEQMEKATSIRKGLAWLLAGISQGKFKARWKFLRAVGKLGLSYWHIQRATAASGYTISFGQNPIFRNEVMELRSQV